MMHLRSTFALLGVLGIFVLGPAPSAFAEGREPAFMQQLYPPELIMRHAVALGLRREQREAITRAVASTQSRTLELQWAMQEAAQKLADQLAGSRVDADAALAAADRVMELETRVKRAHLRMLIEIKNQLDSEQQARLTTLRETSPP